MFDFGNMLFAREQAIAIARDRVDHLPPTARKQILRFIDSLLNQWKLEQADSEGMIEIASWAERGGGLLSVSLNEIANPKSKRMKVSELTPQQCAGPFVNSAYDLLATLWLDKYGPFAAPDQNIQVDICAALLIERDGLDMPVDSLAKAVRLIWMFAWSAATTYKAMLVEKDGKKAQQIAAAQARSVIKKKEQKEDRTSNLRSMAADFYRREPGAKPHAIAARLYERVHALKGYEMLSIAGIQRRIGGVKEAVLNSLGTPTQR